MRFEIKDGPIRVAYGYDDLFGGVFRSVYDERLKFDANSSSDVNAVTGKIGRKDGGGCYFDLHVYIRDQLGTDLRLTMRRWQHISNDLVYQMIGF